MRTASEKLAIIRLVEESELSVRFGSLLYWPIGWMWTQYY